MKVLAITNTAVDLSLQNAPFLSNYTVVVQNTTAGQLLLQSSDAEGSGYATIATVPAGALQEVTLDKQFVKVSTAATLYLLGN